MVLVYFLNRQKHKPLCIAQKIERENAIVKGLLTKYTLTRGERLQLYKQYISISVSICVAMKQDLTVTITQKGG